MALGPKDFLKFRIENVEGPLVHNLFDFTHCTRVRFDFHRGWLFIVSGNPILITCLALFQFC